ncbi:2OG-Fe(II) oxygenase [Paenibacillus sp. N1-5-1-14]|uniref:2OG-Fe(II) oxygenase n=1 Tax=Paenibacillus radicibacter TaxID=2972488 RepID=UPI0021591B0E|nr:2OG-Fe(II) oxygenase [Paenibacillus radicibacter]MCR8643779.1 2OG-Fe(II) oxygenase [Paenibacillus radicibacter]
MTERSGLLGRMESLDWEKLRGMMNEQGYAVIPNLLDKEQCEQIISTYEQDELFRTTINMARYRFGVGEYKYYQSPLPSLLDQLRAGLYPELARLANVWHQHLGLEANYPDSLPKFLEQCHARGQQRPTPLILRYEAGGYNCLHQDLYGEVYFPFQVVMVLTEQGVDYTGGEFLLVEQRPRAQSRGHAIVIEQGSALIFPTQYRPILGSRGYYRATMRHGVSTINAGVRYSLGIIFHDAT